MFEDLGMIEKWRIPKEVLVRYIPTRPRKKTDIWLS